jgi:hypothetical protein
MTRLSPCCKVELTLTAQPESSLSFSAMDAATMTGGKEGNIRTWMLLGSELKGYVRDPEYYFESDDAEHRMNADLLMMIQGWRRYDWRLMSGLEKFKKIQPIEDKLYLFGNLKAYRKRNTIDNVRMNVHLFNWEGGKLKGKATTDSVGYYAFELPDIYGEWEMQIFTKKMNKRNVAKLKTYYVSIDRHFSPRPRRLSYYETRTRDIEKDGFLKMKKSTILSSDDDEYISITKRTHILPQVKVKGKYFTNDSIVQWYNESHAQYWASVYFDCEVDRERILDLGEETPAFLNWRMWKASYYANYLECLLDNDYEGIYFSDTRYKDRENIDILNNKLNWNDQIVNNDIEVGTSNVNDYILDDIVNRKTIENIPEFIDDIKSLYISDDPKAYMRYAFLTDMVNPITNFIYTIPTFSTESQKGLRKTTFQGYNAPSTFKTEDYTDLPPMEDFRRTIFWEPNVKTDKDGKAKIEFFNNSSCTQMYISAEGMTKEGRFIVNE